MALVAFLILYPPLANSSVRVALSPSSRLAVEHLYVTIEQISAHRADTREPDGWFLVSNQSSLIDLAAVNSTQTAGLGLISLGQYDVIRVRIANATAFVNNTSKRVELPSSVFSVPVSFTVGLGMQAVVMLEVVSHLEAKQEPLTLDLAFTAVGEKAVP